MSPLKASTHARYSQRSNDIHDVNRTLVVLQGCTVSLSTVGRVEGLLVRDARGRPVRLTVTSEVLGGTALKVHVHV